MSDTGDDRKTGAAGLIELLDEYGLDRNKPGVIALGHAWLRLEVVSTDPREFGADYARFVDDLDIPASRARLDEVLKKTEALFRAWSESLFLVWCTRFDGLLINGDRNLEAITADIQQLGVEILNTPRGTLLEVLKDEEREVLALEYAAKCRFLAFEGALEFQSRVTEHLGFAVSATPLLISKGAAAC